ncbi:MAG: hypothetical protein ACOYLB_11925 [Phototrophicaceae bacterium]
MLQHLFYLPPSIHHRDALVNTFKQALQARGYHLYDPFGMLPGKSYPHTVKVFVAPADAHGWLRLISQDDLGGWMSDWQVNAIALAMDAQSAQVDCYHEGKPCSPTDMMETLALGESLAQVLEAYEAVKHAHATPTPPPTVVPLTLLPADVQGMAGNLSNQQINSLFEKLTKQLPQGATLTEAQQFVHQQATFDWASPHGQAVTRLMNTLGAPNPSTLPLFSVLRDAYQVHRRLQRKPDRTLLADEDELRRLIPNALDYQPIYAGKEA